MSMCDQGSALKELIRLLRLEEIKENQFRGQSQDLGFGNVFGGQVMAQALSAATRTVDPAFGAHSLHGYFMRAGKANGPIDYAVERVQDGKSFVNRRVTALQKGQVFFSLSCSFQRPEQGFDHQDPMPRVPGPQGIIPESALVDKLIPHLPAGIREKVLAPRPIEIRVVDPMDPFNPQAMPPKRFIWFRAPSPLPKDEVLHKYLLTYASDFHLVSTALYPHGRTFWSQDTQVASLDHAVWFHREFSMDQWHLYAMESPNASGARGMNMGAVYSQDGVRVASVVQEGLTRPMKK